MGFPIGYTEVFVPKLVVHVLSILGFIRNIIISIFGYLGLSDFLETNVPNSASSSWLESPTRFHHPSRSASLIRELLPVVKFEDLGGGDDGDRVPESCAVCLYEFEGGEEIRRLKNCSHIFHRACIDRWLDHDRDTCPLCRNSFVPDELRGEFNKRLWGGVSDAVDDFYEDDFSINAHYSSVPVL